MEPNEVVNALMTGRYGDISAAADDHFRQAVPTTEIERVWLSMTEQYGELAAVGEGSVVLHDLALTFGNGAGHLQIAYRNGVIAGLVLRPGAPTGYFGQ